MAVKNIADFTCILYCFGLRDVLGHQVWIRILHHSSIDLIRLKIKELLWLYIIKISPEFNPSLGADYYIHVGHYSLSRGEKFALLGGVCRNLAIPLLQIPGQMDSSQRTSAFALLLFQAPCLDLLSLHPWCCVNVTTLPSSDSPMKWSQLFNERWEDS